MLTRQQKHELFVSVLTGAVFGCAGYFLTKYIVSSINKTENMVQKGIK